MTTYQTSDGPSHVLSQGGLSVVGVMVDSMELQGSERLSLPLSFRLVRTPSMDKVDGKGDGPPG
ncbi:hypothetical protein HAX54_034514, partial [Datura stramonium]|nr:hypothetical protein [Datura stramonium]